MAEPEREGSSSSSSSSTATAAAAAARPGRGFPTLGSREKKELRAYAHELGKALAVHHVGKWGATEAVAASIGDALEANELIAVKVLDNCPDDVDEVSAQLESLTSAQTVGKIGRKLLLYRPSVTKMAAAAAQRDREAKMRPRRVPTHRTPRRSNRGSLLQEEQGSNNENTWPRM
eukprot:SM000047S16917  [mRNA]  locus=s47:694066:695081:+ [translate_table: standard]